MPARRLHRKRARPKRVSRLRTLSLQTRVEPGSGYRRVCDIALALPGVEESTSYGTPSLKVKGKIIARLRTEADGALALRCDRAVRERLLRADPRTYFITDHYYNYPMVLVRLYRVRRCALAELIERAWRMVAPLKLIAEHTGKVAARLTAA